MLTFSGCSWCTSGCTMVLSTSACGGSISEPSRWVSGFLSCLQLLSSHFLLVSSLFLVFLWTHSLEDSFSSDTLSVALLLGSTALATIVTKGVSACAGICEITWPHSTPTSPAGSSLISGMSLWECAHSWAASQNSNAACSVSRLISSSEKLTSPQFPGSRPFPFEGPLPHDPLFLGHWKLVQSCLLIVSCYRVINWRSASQTTLVCPGLNLFSASFGVTKVRLSLVLFWCFPCLTSVHWPLSSELVIRLPETQFHGELHSKGYSGCPKVCFLLLANSFAHY